MSRNLSGTSILLALTVQFLTSACDDGIVTDCFPTEILVEVSTTDADSLIYNVSVDGTVNQSVGANGGVAFEVEPGEYTLELLDVPDNCTVSGENPRVVNVPNCGPTITTFEVICTASPG